MSRSRKKTPVMGITCSESEAKDKKIWHTRFRHSAKQNLSMCADYEAFVDIDYRSVSNPWLMSKDGRQWIDVKYKDHIKFMRK